MKNTEKFGLFTTISMIVGTVIGSGIFFKSDDILIATQGSVLIGVALWSLGALGIVFGGLCIADYAKQTAEAGGLITYIELAWGKLLGFLAGWFQTIFYFPAIVAILSWVTAVYIGLLLGITDPTDGRLWAIALTVIGLAYLLNILNSKGAGFFQNITLIIKISALLILSVIGIVFGDVSNITSQTMSSVPVGAGLFAGLIACAFSYDGWFVAPTVAHEIKNPKRNLSKALIIAPMIILLVYLTYFIGINMLLGPEQVIQMGDGSVGLVAERLFGTWGTKVVYIAVIVSIVGSINGLTLGYIRLPYSLAIRNQFPASKVFNKVHKSLQVSIPSALLSLGLVLIWLGLHALSVFKIKFLGFAFEHLQIDSLPIVLIYIFYSMLYIKTIMDQFKSKSKGVKAGYVYPVLALLGASFVIYGGLSQPMSLKYFIISFIGIALGYCVMDKRSMKRSNV